MCNEGGKKKATPDAVLNNLAARRKQFLNFAFLLVLLISQRNITVPRPVRSCCQLKRSTGWWENVCNTYWGARFKKAIRVFWDTFNSILNRIAPFLIRQTVTEEPITPAPRLAIYLYSLGRGDYLYTISEMSGLGVSTVCSICQEVCQVLVDIYGMRHASDWRRVQRRDSRCGGILAISLLLDSHRWLPYCHEIHTWRTSSMQRLP